MKPGDHVRLKTGEQAMEVKSIDEYYVQCTWTNKLNAEMHGSFPKHLLTTID